MKADWFPNMQKLGSMASQVKAATRKLAAFDVASAKQNIDWDQGGGEYTANMVKQG
jgi:hypothetical protein